MALNLGLDNRVLLPPFLPVQRNQDGYYTLSVPKGSLKPGTYAIQVFGVEGSRREALETYSVRQP